MSSINTNTSAMNALSTLRNVNSNLNQTQDRISTGLKVSSGKDNASYFAISETMKGDSGMTKAVNESLTLTKNSIATARVGTEQVGELANQFLEKLAFAQNNQDDFDKVAEELTKLVADMKTTVSQSTFNGDDLVNAADTATANATITDEGVMTGDVETTATRDVVTGVTRSSGFATTSISFDSVDLTGRVDVFDKIATDFATNAAVTTDSTGSPGTTKGDLYLQNVLKLAEKEVGNILTAETSLGLAEKSIENQQGFLTKLADNLDAGVGAMVDANMEEEAARLQALQVQQQLASQSLSIANQAPQNILSLFR
ncbi:flagellar protein [Sulfitobacter sp. S0837]|uniref:flagellin N-terminal helical domain-containing protein n=1 Tax=Sulfitobacter maritimus TaxID=2741719 RepID=UPI001583741E|nr:flagellin [Sulfitobacter maritimus]NUH64957.1 flagellar protein [Sulfitobacter maritimus]